MIRDLMVVLFIVAFVAGLFAFLGTHVLNFHGKRLAKFVGVAAAVTTAACWAFGLLSRVPSAYLVLVPLAGALVYTGLKLDEWRENAKAFVTRAVRARKT